MTCPACHDEGSVLVESNPWPVYADCGACETPSNSAGPAVAETTPIASSGPATVNNEEVQS